MKPLFLLCTVGLIASLTLLAGEPTAQQSTDAALEESAAGGGRIYRNGILPSGNPITANVLGDIPFEGAQFNCQTCHQRSGMGTSEGALIAPMVTFNALYEPKVSGKRKRPAYTDESLMRAIREGTDSAGNSLDPIMPRYPLTDSDSRDLIEYLKRLSRHASPGVTEDSVRFATVVTDGVDATPMLAVLNTFFEEKNNQLRNPKRRAASGPFFRANVNDAYRSWDLDVWMLTGPRESWRAQLESKYREAPVFAFVSGMVDGPWQPIHEFCEDHEVPCLLPNTNSPSTDAGYYTLYYSMGLALEANVIADRIAENTKARRIVQVFRSGTDGEQAARRVRDRLPRGKLEIDDLKIDAGIPIGDSKLRKKLNKLAPETLIVWLDSNDLHDISMWEDFEAFDAPNVYLSSTLNDGDPTSIPAKLRGPATVAHPFSLDELFQTRFRRIDAWLSSRKIEGGNELIQAQSYFACMLIGESLMHIKYDFYFRDYMLESIDHMTVLANFSASHPSLSFGPGQRFVSKGCYLLPPTGSDAAPEWIVPGM